MSGQDVAIIVGAGSGLSASLARRFARAGMKVALAARDTEKLAGIQSETGRTCMPVIRWSLIR